jgi:hypothetical protein
MEMKKRHDLKSKIAQEQAQVDRLKSEMEQERMMAAEKRRQEKEYL